MATAVSWARRSGRVAARFLCSVSSSAISLCSRFFSLVERRKGSGCTYYTSICARGRHPAHTTRRPLRCRTPALCKRERAARTACMVREANARVVARLHTLIVWCRLRAVGVWALQGICLTRMLLGLARRTARRVEKASLVYAALRIRQSIVIPIHHK